MIGSLARSLERFLLPNACVVCEGAVAVSTPDALVCSVCVSRLETVPPGCPRCQQPIPPVGPCRFCAGWPANLTAVRSAVWLGTEARAIAHHLKYEGYTAVGREVGRIINHHVARPAAAALVPIPLSLRRQRERGYNQASVIAHELAGKWGVPIVERVLQRTRETRSQTALSPDERHENVSGAFVADSPPTPSATRGQAAPIILIDDVLTTGATVVAAAEALQVAGWQAIAAITFARALPFARRVRAG